MGKGIISAIIYYLIGGATTGIVYAIFGQQYAHAPGPHYIVLFFTLLGGLLWAAISAYKFFVHRKSERLKGIIITNVVVVLCFVLIFSYIINSENQSSDIRISADYDIQSETHGDTTTIHYNGNLIYLRVKDSVYFNLVESLDLK